MKSIIAYSGGIDSTVVAYDTVDSEGPEAVELAHIDIGSKTSTLAIEAMKYHADILGVPWTVIPIALPSVVTAGCRVFSSKGEVGKRAVNSLDDKSLLKKELTLWNDYAPGLYTIIWVLLGALAVRRGCQRVLTGFHRQRPEGKQTLEGLSEDIMDTCADFTDYLNGQRIAIWGAKAPMFYAPLRDIDKRDVVALGKNLEINFDMTHSCDIYPSCGVCYECRLREEALDG